MGLDTIKDVVAWLKDFRAVTGSHLLFTGENRFLQGLISIARHYLFSQMNYGILTRSLPCRQISGG